MNSRNYKKLTDLKIPFFLRWCCARDLFGAQISVITGEFEQRTSCMQCNYLTHYVIRSNSLGEFGVPNSL